MVAERKHSNPAFPCLHNGDLSPMAARWDVSNGEFHPPSVKHEKLVPPIHNPIEAAASVLAPGERRAPWRHAQAGHQIAPGQRSDGSPLPSGGREGEGDELGFALHHTDHSERSLILWVPAVGTVGGEEVLAPAVELQAERVLHCCGQVVGDRGQQDAAPVQGVAHRYLREDLRVLASVLGVGGAVEEDAAVADVAHDPAAARGGGGEEREGEIRGERDRPRRGGGCVGRERRVEAVVVQEAEERRGVERAEPAEERAVGDEAAEGDAGGRGANEVGRLRKTEEDVRQEVVGEQRRRGHVVAGRRERGHLGLGVAGESGSPVKFMG